MNKTCVWEEKDNGDYTAWVSSCGGYFQFEAEGPIENGMKFCPYCGCTLVTEIAATEPEPDESKKEIGLKMARAYPDQIEAMRQWFHDIEAMFDDENKDAHDIGRFVIDTFETRRIDEYERILFGYETMFDNACDPALSYLEFKPEILEAMKNAKI